MKKDICLHHAPMPIEPKDHPVFQAFKPWKGRAPAGFDVNFTGQKIDLAFHSNWMDEGRRQERDAWPPYPPVSEEIFEWITLLKAVLETKDRFVMIEAGAGYGRWLVTAACAMRSRRPDVRYDLIGIEADPTHYAWMSRHFHDNNIDQTQHRLLHGAVADADGEDSFVTGDPAAWYGQSLVASTDQSEAWFPAGSVIRIKTYSLNTLLANLDHVDVLDCDIQGAEKTAIPAAMAQITKKVRRAFIETHGTEIDQIIVRAFKEHGWHSDYSYACFSEADTEFGRIAFSGGGAQCWINPILT